MLIDVHLLDAVTGDRAIYKPSGDWEIDEAFEFLWSEGNYSCDCNRSLFFAHAKGRDRPAVECGTGWFIIEKITERGADRVLYEEN